MIVNLKIIYFTTFKLKPKTNFYEETISADYFVSVR